jgi:hypothetical protein
MSNDRTYNGWSTYETWLVNLWIQNEESLYAALHADVVDAPRLYDAKEVLQAWLDNEYDLYIEERGHGLFQDLLKGALQEVNWYEIAKNWRDEE